MVFSHFLSAQSSVLALDYAQEQTGKEYFARKRDPGKENPGKMICFVSAQLLRYCSSLGSQIKRLRYLSRASRAKVIELGSDHGFFMGAAGALVR